MRLYDFGFTFILVASVCAGGAGGGGAGRLSGRQVAARR